MSEKPLVVPIGTYEGDEKAIADRGLEASFRPVEELPNILPGYPVVPPEHLLWDDQQKGWPGRAAHEAWVAALETQRREVTDSRLHPAFKPGYISNPHATRPDEDRPAPVALKPGENARR